MRSSRTRSSACNKEGTSAAAFLKTPYVSAGKTGTAQVFSLKGEKYSTKIDERLRDHAWFIAYAPADKPRIAVSVLVENGGFGAQAAAPIARQVFDYYLTGEGDDGAGADRSGARRRGRRERLDRANFLTRLWEVLTQQGRQLPVRHRDGDRRRRPRHAVLGDRPERARGSRARRRASRSRSC